MYIHSCLHIGLEVLPDLINVSLLFYCFTAPNTNTWKRVEGLLSNFSTSLHLVYDT